MVKRWTVKFDETEIPDGDYVRAADYARLRAALMEARRDLNVYSALPSNCWPGPSTSALEKIDAMLAGS